jgi:DNA-binding CsgD family transcriptional regulator
VPATARSDQSPELIEPGAESCWALLRGRRQFAIAEPVCVVGRGDDAHLQLNDLGVSRRHAVLRVDDGQLYVEDLGSRNGTFVQGQQIDRKVPVQAGDELSFGPCELRVGLFSGKRRVGDCTTQQIPRALLDRSQQVSPLESLSPRERELLPLLASGLSQRELASQLGVTVKTIETYRTRIGHKLGLTSRAGLIRFALDHGLLSAAHSLNEL